MSAVTCARGRAQRAKRNGAPDTASHDCGLRRIETTSFIPAIKYQPNMPSECYTKLNFPRLAGYGKYNSYRRTIHTPNRTVRLPPATMPEGSSLTPVHYSAPSTGVPPISAFHRENKQLNRFGSHHGRARQIIDSREDYTVVQKHIDAPQLEHTSLTPWIQKNMII